MDSHHIDLRTLHAALGGDISGSQILCAGPGHSQRDRSLAVKPTASGFIVFSHAGDDWRECRGHVYARLGLPQWRSHTITWTEPNKSNKSVENARRIWGEGTDPRGTSAERYLAARKLDLPPELSGSVLRFHARCPWRTDGQLDFVACLIAAFRSIDNDEVTAIHRIRVDRPERWPSTERRMLGTVAGSAIKLDPPGEQFAVAEGLESALAARQLGFGPTWALGSARAFPPIDSVDELIVLGEGDATSRKMAEASARLWQGHGAVSLAVPACDGDFNDLLLMGVR